MESLFLSEVSPTGVFREVQLEKVEAREKTIKMIGNLFPLMERFKTLDDTIEQNISIFDTIGWPEGKNCEFWEC